MIILSTTEKATFQTSICLCLLYVLFKNKPTNRIISVFLLQHGNVFPSDRFMDRIGPS